MKVKSISVSFGVSVNPNPGTWLKWSAGMDMTASENDTEQDIMHAWDYAWETCVQQVNTQARASQGN